MEKISDPMFRMDTDLNIINHDRQRYPDEKLPKMTLTEFINKIKNNEQLEGGTFVYITMHDLVKESSNWSEEVFVHVPTNTKLLLETEEDDMMWSRAWLLIDDKKIWIGDEVDGEFQDMTCPFGDINAFEFKSFQEWS